MQRYRFLPWINWGVTTTFVLFQFFLQVASGLMAAQWQVDFQLTTTEVGSLSAAFFISYVLMQIPVGFAYDNFSSRTILITASVLLCLGTFSLAFSHYYWQAFIARIMMGTGSAFGFVGMLYVTASWFSERHFVLLIGISETLAMLGVALGEVGMAWIVTHYGWRSTMIIGGWGALITHLFVLLAVKDQKNPLKKESEKKALPLIVGIKKVFSNKQVWLSGIYGFALFSIVNVVITLWGTPFFIHQYHVSLPTAGTMMSTVFIGIAIGGPFNAWLVQRWGKRQEIMTSFALITALIFAILLYIPQLPFWSLYLLLISLGFFSSSYIHIFAVVKNSVPEELRATALSTTNMLLMSSAPLLQPLIGKLLQLNYTYPQALSVILIILGTSALLSLKMDKE
jgi:MFS family permease